MSNIDVDKFRRIYETDDAYKSVRENDKMKDIHILCLSGSHAYGTARPDSDIDIRGVVGVKKSIALGVEADWYTVNFKETDTEIYSIKNFLSLIAKGNPSILCLLGNDIDDYLYLSKPGRMLVEDYDGLFTAKSVYNSFIGYANSRFRELELAELSKLNDTTNNTGNMLIEDKKIEILNNATSLFGIKYTTADNVSASYEILDDVVYIKDFSATNISMTDLFDVVKDLKNISSSFGKKGKRNKKKTDFKLNKHCMHLIRGLKIGIELLETGKIVTYRHADLDLLHSILNGDYMGNEGSMRNEFYELVDDLKKKADYAFKYSVLPNALNIDKLIEYSQIFYLEN